MPEHQKACYLIIDYDVPSPPNSSEIAKLLEKGSEEEQIDAMKTLILMILQDEHFPRLIMTVVQHAMRVDSKEMKKLLMIYWESIEKTNPDGTIKDEMVMLCNALRNDLLSPNEFIRARTLRLVSKMRYREMMDTLLQPALECLTHRHPYVRRNAVMCVYSIYTSFGEDILPDAVDRIDSLLQTETDLSTRRNALLFLFEASPSTAMRYLNSVLLDEEDSSNSVYGTSIDILQLVVLDELKRVCKANPLEKGKYMKSIFNLALTSKSHSVLFECANTIIQLTSMANHIKLAVSTYLKLLNDPSSDNNMKLILVENLLALKQTHKRILQEQAVELLRALSSPSIDIRTTCVNLVLDLLTERNVEDVIRIFKKELLAVQGKKEEIVYQDLLVNALHTCAVSYPGITEQVGLVEVLMDSCLLQEGTDTDVSSFIQQIVVEYPTLRPVILNKLTHIFAEIVSGNVYRTALWILAEFSEDAEKAINCILNSIGEGPYFNKKERTETVETQSPGQKSTKTIILPDGTYGTQILSAREVVKPKHLTGLRKLLTEVEEVDFYLITIISKSLAKLFHRVPLDRQEPVRVSILTVLCGIVQIKSYPKKSRKSEEFSDVPVSIDPENFEQVVRCVQCLTGLAEADFVQGGLGLYSSSQQEFYKKTEENALEAQLTQPDDLIAIKQLRGKDGLSDLDFSDDSLFRSIFVDKVQDDFAAKLNNVRTLTGLDDVVYVEVSLKMNHYDIILDFGVFNRSNDTLKNVTLELAVEGELKLVEKPQIVNIGPGQQVPLKACVKVNNTEAGVIFGNLTYDTARGGNVKVISLNEIVVDTIEYIYPATCSDNFFRKMWQEFKWEYPVTVTSTSTRLEEFVKKIAEKSNMQILTPDGVLKCSQNFLVCNMYAKSRFNEDALMNVSLEMKESGISGNVRIRTKTQGMAKCLGLRVLDITRSE